MRYRFPRRERLRFCDGDDREVSMMVADHACSHAVLHLAVLSMSVVVVSALYRSVRHTVQLGIRAAVLLLYTTALWQHPMSFGNSWWRLLQIPCFAGDPTKSPRLGVQKPAPLGIIHGQLLYFCRVVSMRVMGIFNRLTWISM